MSVGLGGGSSSGLTNTQLRESPVEVTVTNPGGGSSGGLTDDELRAAPVTVDGTVAVSGVSGTVAVSGPVTDAQLRATPVPVSGTVAVDGAVAVSGPLTDTELRATPVPVSGTFYQATQPVSLAAAVTVNNLIDGNQRTQLVNGANIAAVSATGALKVDGSSSVQPVSGPLTDAQLRNSAVTVAANNTSAAAPLAVRQSNGTTFISPAAAGDAMGRTWALAGNTDAVGITYQGSAPATDVGSSGANVLRVVLAPTNITNSSTPVGSVSLGNATNKTTVMKTGTLVTNAVTANQVIVTYTVTAGQTFYLQYLEFRARLTTFAATATNFGTISLENPSGTKLFTTGLFHAGTADGFSLQFAEPMRVDAGTVIRLVCTPSTTTSYTWFGNFGGYEK